MCKCGCDGNDLRLRGRGCRLTTITGRRRKAPQPTDERYNEHAAAAVRAWQLARMTADDLYELAWQYDGDEPVPDGLWQEASKARAMANKMHHEMVQAQRIARAIRTFTRNAGTPAF